MAEAQTGLSNDENAVPYYKWPPFPGAPPGVTIVPFEKFAPSGIQLSLDDDDDGNEFDGEGIPTVQLQVKHDLDAPLRKKKKTKKVATGEEVVRRFVWWEEWAAGEDLRVHQYDGFADRIAQAVEDFKKDREWPGAASRVQEWYYRFVYYIGIETAKSWPRPRFHRKEEEPNDEIEEEEEEAVSTAKSAQPIEILEAGNEASSGNGKPKTNQDSVYAESKEQYDQRVERYLEARERRFEAFLSNPELAMKIFFSSYFRDGGMMWENLALRDAPRVILFFLNSLLRNRAMPGSEKSLRAAIKVTERAKDELPRTKQIGTKIPDELSSCLTVIYGSRLRKFVWSTRPAPDDDDSDKPQAKKAKLDVDDTATAEFTADLKANGVVLLADDAVSAEPSAEAVVDDGGWHSAGSGANIAWGEGTESFGADENPWGQTPTYGGWAQPAHSLMALLGPTLLPVTHTIGYVEESTRYISNVTMPDTWNKDKELDAGSYSDLFRQFARVELKPYPVFSTFERAAVQKPEILEDPLANVVTGDASSSEIVQETPRIPRHDPEKDSIMLLLDPKAAEDMLRGMGLGGTFVQVIPDYAMRTSESSPSRGGGGRGRGRGIGRSDHPGVKPRPSEEIFWYAEKILQVIPSFWTEKHA
ncbi:hypothetical protein M0805_004475 [Coniferiporia weirii]|nr:hypothetical protein M0805_004475 [Coniferiporia weirii]